MEEIKQLNKFEKNRLNEQNIQQEDESKKSKDNSDKFFSLDEKKTLIGNKEYGEDTLNRITIELTQKGVPQSKIKNIFLYHHKRKPKIIGRPPKFYEKQKEFIYKAAESKMTIINKVSSRNIALKFSNKFNESISKSTVNIDINS